jgi:predicted nucleic acid-binding protein
LGYDGGTRYQTNDYPEFIAKALGKCSLLASVVNLVELSSIIENKHYEIYKEENNSKISKKEYRHTLKDERASIVEDIQNAWDSLCQCAEIVNIEANSTTDVNTILDNIAKMQIDAYDLMILNLMKKQGIKNILSDDSDFATVPYITLYTANPTIIKNARGQGKLIS